MKIQKLESTDAFIVFDLDGAPSAGVVRSAPKILVDGASLLARTLTYRFATFERRVGGASAGINATPDARADAVAAFVAEVEPRVREGEVWLDPAKGVNAGAFAALRAADGRPEAYWDAETDLTGVGVAAAADAATGGLAGRAVAIEGFDGAGPSLAREIVARGGRVVAVGTSEGTAHDATGLDPAELTGLWAEYGPALVGRLSPGADGGAGTAWAVLGIDCDVLVVGSKPGVLDDRAAAGVVAPVVVPGGAVPVTAKGLAVLRRAGRVVVPDFVSTAGPLFAGWPLDDDDPSAVAVATISASVADVLGHDDGPLLGACYRAEAFLSSWREALPFGRPLA